MKNFLQITAVTLMFGLSSITSNIERSGAQHLPVVPDVSRPELKQPDEILEQVSRIKNGMDDLLRDNKDLRAEKKKAEAKHKKELAYWKSEADKYKTLYVMEKNSKDTVLVSYVVDKRKGWFNFLKKRNRED